MSEDINVDLGERSSFSGEMQENDFREIEPGSLLISIPRLLELGDQYTYSAAMACFCVWVRADFDAGTLTIATGFPA